MRNAFKSEDHQKQFEKYGYIIVHQFLNSDEIEHLRNEYLSINNDLGKGFHATMHSQNINYRRKISEIIGNIFTNKSNLYLDNYKHLVSNFTVKEPGKESFFDFHLDWNMVDETLCRSVTVWCPLEDTNEKNGNLWILESSNQLGNSYRCGPGLALYFENKNELKNKKFKKVSLPMKAGTAIIYDHKLFHGSPPNMTNKPRIAINQAMCPADFPTIHYTSDNKGNIESRIVDEDYYNRCIINRLDSEGSLYKTLKINSNPATQKDINNMIYI